MFLLHRPADDRLRELIAAQRELPFTYPAVGATRRPQPPRGFVVDHNRVRLGSGAEAYRRAVEAVQSWRMFDLGWLQLCWPDAPIAAGTAVGLLVRHLGLWSVSTTRVVYVLDERGGPVQRHGFAYGTLPHHVECGEERFTVEWRRDDDSVWYDLYAFSRPQHPLARLGYPYTRLLQKRFARDSKQAMVRAVQPDESKSEK
jgi:uncharacterized protein (UPF0548 family)